MSLVVGLFLILLVLMVLMGTPYTLDVKWIPQFIRDVYVYGKPVNEKSPIISRFVKLIHVPKRYTEAKSHI